MSWWTTATSAPLYGTRPSMPSGTSFSRRVLALGILEVAVGRALLHRAERAHAAVALVRAALVELDLARRLLGAGEEAPQHHARRRPRRSPSRCRPSSGSPPSAISGTSSFGDAFERVQIAVICGTPTPATMRVVQIEPGPMPTLIASAPASASRARARRRRRRCRRSTCNLGKCPLDPAHALEHALRVAVRGVDDDHVDAGGDQRFDAFLGVAGRADRGADAQLPELVLARERMLGRLEDVLDRDEPLQLEASLTTSTRSSRCGASAPWPRSSSVPSRHGHQLVALGHDRCDRLVEVGLEAQVAVGDDADDLPACRRRAARRSRAAA